MVIIKALAWVLSLAAVVTWLVAWYAGTVRSPVIGANAKAAPFPRCHENGQDSTGQE